jgi:molybdate transport system regulatory protein
MSRVLLRLYLTSGTPLGPGKVQLLEAVRDLGSISAAARTLRMSYRSAWLRIDSMNAAFRTPLVRTTLGGRGGGAAVLTALGTKVVRRFRSMEAATRRAVASDLAALEKGLRPDRRGRRSPARRSPTA